MPSQSVLPVSAAFPCKRLLKLCTCLLPGYHRQRQRAARGASIVWARKTREYSDYYSSDEARELSQMLPDPNSLFDDSEWLRQGGQGGRDGAGRARRGKQGAKCGLRCSPPSLSVGWHQRSSALLCS